jgi:hypothetical protein
VPLVAGIFFEVKIALLVLKVRVKMRLRANFHNCFFLHSHSVSRSKQKIFVPRVKKLLQAFHLLPMLVFSPIIKV